MCGARQVCAPHELLRKERKHMKVGVSMPPALICGRASSEQQKKLLAAFDGIDGWLSEVRKAGAESIELRTITAEVPQEDVARAVSKVREYGFFMTVHSVLTDEAPEAFWGRMIPVLDAQGSITVTVHSVKDREYTLNLLRRMAEYALTHHPGARLALENNRTIKGDNADLVECGGVLQTVQAAGHENIGVCWDFGHLYWDYLNHPSLVPGVLPPEGYTGCAIHTHIHSVACGRTHYPLSVGVLPLAEYIGALKQVGYQGVYNFEPAVERWSEDTDMPGEFLRSIEILKSAAEG